MVVSRIQKKEWHPCPENSQLGAVVRSVLVTQVDTVHLVVVVVDDPRNVENGGGLSTESCMGMLGIGACGSWATTKSRCAGIFTNDVVDGAEHRDRRIVNPYNGKDRVVHNLARESVPFQFHFFVDLEHRREMLGGGTNGAACTNLEFAQMFEKIDVGKKVIHVNVEWVGLMREGFGKTNNSGRCWGEAIDGFNSNDGGDTGIVEEGKGVSSLAKCIDLVALRCGLALHLHSV
jgi:hypothetical protein